MALEVFSNIKIPNHRSGGYYALNASLVSAPLKASIVNSFGSRRHFDLDNLTSHVPELQFWSLIDTGCSPFFTALCSRSSCSHNVALYRPCGLRSSSFRHKKLSLSRNNLCECSYLSFGQSLGWSRGELWGELLLENNYYHAAVQLKKPSSPSADTTKACNFTRRNRLKIKLQPHGFTIVRSHLNFLGKHSSVQSDYWYPVKSLDSEQFLNKEFATQATGRPDFSLHTKLKCLARYLEYGGQAAEDSWECLLGSFSAGRQKEEKPEIHSSWKVQRWRPNRSNHQKTSIRAQFTQAQLLTSARPRQALQPNYFPHRQVRRNCVPQSRDTPPKRDTGIASEKDWGITLNNGKTNESGVNEDGSTWYRESGVDIGDNGYRCRWTVMGGQSADSSIEWKEAWWEKSDWTGYKELGAEKSGKNAAGDSWWETWQEVLRQDDWSNLARIEKSAQKQAKSGDGVAGWYEKWWEKYNAKGWTDKGAHKYGRLNDQAWWEKWGEQYDGQGAVLKWTDKWAENAMGEKWGDKWEERFEAGLGTRQGETWHASAGGERWSRTWGEEHFGNRKVHKYGRSSSGESWDNMVEEGTFYKAEPHYGWADAVGNSAQLLSIEPLERPPGVYPDLDFGPLPPPPP